MFLLTAFVFGFGMAATILVGQAWGRKDVKGARQVFGTAAGAFGLATIGIAAAGYFLSHSILALLGTPAEAAPLAHAYLSVIFLAMPPLLLLTLMMMALRGAGDSMTPLWFMILSVVLDSGLNPVFILGLGPAPRMGIAGAAFSTLLANYVAFFGLVGYIYLKDLPLRLRGPELRYLWCDVAILKTIVVKGFPMGLQMVVLSVSALALVGMVNQEGVETAAAFGVAMQLWTYVQMPAMALGAAVSAMAAQNVGARRMDRVERVAWVGAGYSIFFALGPILLVLATQDFLLLAFLPADSGALPIAKHINMIALWSFVPFSMAFAFSGVVRANGVVWPPLIAMVVALWFVRIPYAQIMEPYLGADAVWSSFPVGSVATLAIALGYFRWGRWRNARLVDTIAHGETPDPGQGPSIGFEETEAQAEAVEAIKRSPR
jgi:putative MATE family efflux protein